MSQAAQTIARRTFSEETSHQRFESSLLRLYDRFALAHTALHSNHILVRILLFPFVFALYLIMLFFMVGIVLHVPSAQIFAHFQNLDPKKGYTVSYTEYQHRLKLAQGIVLTSLVVVLIIFYYFFVIPALGLYKNISI